MRISLRILYIIVRILRISLRILRIFCVFCVFFAYSAHFFAYSANFFACSAYFFVYSSSAYFCVYSSYFFAYSFSRLSKSYVERVYCHGAIMMHMRQAVAAVPLQQLICKPLTSNHLQVCFPLLLPRSYSDCFLQSRPSSRS
jgi:hypothetical protein